MEWLQIIVTLLLFILIIVPLGKYLYCVSSQEKTFADRIFNPIDNFIYKVCGINKDEQMNWKQYVLSIVTVNAAI